MQLHLEDAQMVLVFLQFEVPPECQVSWARLHKPPTGTGSGRGHRSYTISPWDL